MGQFAVYLQSFDAEKHLDAGVLHFFRPADVRRFVEAGHQFYHDRYFLAVLGGADQRFDHFGIFGEPVNRRFDAAHVAAQRRFPQHLDIVRKAVVGIVHKNVPAADLVERAAEAVHRRNGGGHPLFELQIAAAAIRESHQVFHIVVARPADAGVVAVDAEFALQIAQHLFGHSLVVNEADRFPLFAVPDAPGHFFDQSFVDVAVQRHLGVAREFQRVGFERFVTQPGEDERQAETHHVVEEDDAGRVAVRRQHDETVELAGRQFDQREVAHRFSGCDISANHFDGQIDA